MTHSLRDAQVKALIDHNERLLDFVRTYLESMPGLQYKKYRSDWELFKMAKQLVAQAEENGK
jgi:hypothetical protein